MVMSVRPLDQTTWPGAACGIPTEDGSGSSWERFLITLSSMKKLAVTPVSSISIDAVGIAVTDHVAGDLDGVDACHRSRRTEEAAVALGLQQESSFGRMRASGPHDTSVIAPKDTHACQTICPRAHVHRFDERSESSPGS